MLRYRSFYTFLLSFSLLCAAWAQQPEPDTQVPSATATNPNEVLLDVLVHDKKGRPVRDLKPEEIEILEDGVKQHINKFEMLGSLFESGRKTQPTGAATAATYAASDPKARYLVTLLFDQLHTVHVQPVRDAAYYFIDSLITPDMLVRVMTTGKRLYIVEQFTNDRAKLRKAVERVTNANEKSFAENSDRVVTELKSVAAGTDKDNALLAKITLDAVNGSEKLYSETKNPLAVFSLLPFARAQQQAPGRKIALYFSDGMFMPAGFNEVVRTAVSESNRANVSFYSINVRQLLANAATSLSKLEAGSVDNQTRRQENSAYDSDIGLALGIGGGALTQGPRTRIDAFDSVSRNKEFDKRTPLVELTEGTGGFLLTKQNDLNGALRKTASELSNYYLLSYQPSRQEHDGKFHTITVNILRPGLKAQTRSGYAALAPTAELTRPVISYETPLLTALNNPVIPHDFPTRVGIFHFESRQNETRAAVMLELPYAPLLNEQPKEEKFYDVSFAVLGVLKDEKGEVIQRFSEPHGIQISTAMLETAKTSSFTLTRNFWLAPGNYTLEFAVHDQKTNRFSVQRQPFTVALNSKPLQTSSLFLVKQVEQVAEQSADADNPFIAERKKIIPDLTDEIAVTAHPDLSFHLTLFPDKQLKATPTLKLELLRDGKPVASTSPKLPKPAADGRINFTAGMPTAGLASGKYQFHAVATQGVTTVEETTAFIVAGGRAVAPSAAEEKTISSTLSANDKVGELTLSSLKAVEPIEVKLNELIQQVTDAGARSYMQLADYTYSLRKVRRTLNPQGRIRNEQYQDYEAYPVRGRHALIQRAENGTALSIDRINADRRAATNTLIKNEENKQASDLARQEELGKKASYWAAGLEGQIQKRGQQRRDVYVTLDADIFLQSCEFSSPRSVLLAGRPTIVLNFKPRPDAKLNVDQEWARQMIGTLWIDASEKALVRIEGQAMTAAETDASAQVDNNAPINFIYQQQRLADGVWAPSLIRINSAGDENVLQGLNWDAWFEFTNFKRFDARDSDVKIVAPTEKRQQ